MEKHQLTVAFLFKKKRAQPLQLFGHELATAAMGEQKLLPRGDVCEEVGQRKERRLLEEPGGKLSSWGQLGVTAMRHSQNVASRTPKVRYPFWVVEREANFEAEDSRDSRHVSEAKGT